MNVFVGTLLFVSTFFIAVKVYADLWVPFIAFFRTAAVSIFTYCIFMPLGALISEFAKSNLNMVTEIKLMLFYFLHLYKWTILKSNGLLSSEAKFKSQVYRILINVVDAVQRKHITFLQP